MSEPLTPDEIATAKGSLQSLRDEIGEADLSWLESQFLRALDELEQLRAEAEAMAREVRITRAERDHYNARMLELMNGRDQLRAEVERLKTESARLVP